MKLSNLFLILVVGYISYEIGYNKGKCKEPPEPIPPIKEPQRENINGYL